MFLNVKTSRVGTMNAGAFAGLVFNPTPIALRATVIARANPVKRLPARLNAVKRSVEKMGVAAPVGPAEMRKVVMTASVKISHVLLCALGKSVETMAATGHVAPAAMTKSVRRDNAKSRHARQHAPGKNVVRTNMVTFVTHAQK